MGNCRSSDSFTNAPIQPQFSGLVLYKQVVLPELSGIGHSGERPHCAMTDWLLHRTCDSLLCDRRHSARSGSSAPRSRRHKAVLSPAALTSSAFNGARFLARPPRRMVEPCRQRNHWTFPDAVCERDSKLAMVLRKRARISSYVRSEVLFQSLLYERR